MTQTAFAMAPEGAAWAGAWTAPGPSLGLLTDGDADEVLAFLAERPLHTVGMAGFVLDNGLESPLNRGDFYACRDARGRLEGVALIGHAVLVEARTEEATALFAKLAQGRPGAHMILGEEQGVELFWSYYAEGGQAPRRMCRELLLEQRWPVEAREPVAELRVAEPSDLEAIVPVHARMAFEESGVDPLASDAEGFRARCLRRIEMGRVWVSTDAEGRLLFKADLVAETPQAVYVEGVYVAESERGRGYGVRCLSQLARELLLRSESVYLLVNELNAPARAFYEKVGFKPRGVFDTVFLKR